MKNKFSKVLLSFVVFGFLFAITACSSEIDTLDTPAIPKTRSADGGESGGGGPIPPAVKKGLPKDTTYINPPMDLN